jgi:hypothetical protein
MSVKRKINRNIEIITGLLLIMTVISILVAFLLKFDYTVPIAPFEEDLDFLMDNISRQKVLGAANVNSDNNLFTHSVICIYLYE